MAEKTTAAERQRAHRARRTAAGYMILHCELSPEAAAALDKLTGEGRTKAAAVSAALVDYARRCR